MWAERLGRLTKSKNRHKMGNYQKRIMPKRVHSSEVEPVEINNEYKRGIKL